MICPILKDECLEKACSWWCYDDENCAVNMLGHCVQEISFAADNANLDCGIRVCIIREDVADGD